MHKLRQYLKELLEANRQFNLTAVRDEAEAWDRHIVECVRLVPFIQAKALLDVGSGGGLPGLVIAICCPSTKVTLLEATEKKARFLEATAKKLDLSNVRVISERAETAAQAGSPHRECFDLVTARAVAPLRTLLELTVPFLKVGGTLLAMKGQKAEEEVEMARRARSLLHVHLREIVENESGRILLLEKTGITPAKYPRRSGSPKHDPL